MCRSPAESVSCCYVPRVAASAGVAENFLVIHAQGKAELVIVRVASFAKDSVRNGKKQQFSRPMAKDADPRVRKNCRHGPKAGVGLSLKRCSAIGGGKAIPLGVFDRAAPFIKQALPQTEQIGNAKRVSLGYRGRQHLFHVVQQKFHSTIVTVSYVRKFAGRAGQSGHYAVHASQLLLKTRCRSIVACAHEKHRNSEHLGDKYVITSRRLVVASIFVNLLKNRSFNLSPIETSFVHHLPAIEKKRETVQANDIA